MRRADSEWWRELGVYGLWLDVKSLLVAVLVISGLGILIISVPDNLLWGLLWLVMWFAAIRVWRIPDPPAVESARTRVRILIQARGQCQVCFRSPADFVAPLYIVPRVERPSVSRDEILVICEDCLMERLSVYVSGDASKAWSKRLQTRMRKVEELSEQKRDAMSLIVEAEVRDNNPEDDETQETLPASAPRTRVLPEDDAASGDKVLH